jgi:hypothetical protein
MNATLYIKHESGAMHQISGRKAAQFRREIAAGGGGKECTDLTERGSAERLGEGKAHETAPFRRGR